MTRIMLIRHGQASFGQADYDCLSAIGDAQARHLGATMRERGETIDTVWYGPMRRHLQTAQAWHDGYGPVRDMRAHPLFGEFDHREVIACHEPRYQDHEVLMREMVASGSGSGAFAAFFKGALARWQSGAHDADYTESWPQFQSRCRAALQDLYAHAPGDAVHCVFTSGGVISAIVQHLLGLDDAATMRLNWNLANASITCVQRASQGRWTLVSFNEHGHFRGDQRDLLTWR